MLWVLKLNHTKGDSETFQMFLTSFSFGVKSFFFSGDIDEDLILKTKEQGLNIKHVEEPVEWINEQRKTKEIINFHPQGIKLYSILDRIKESKKDKILVLGSKKIPDGIFAIADYNINVKQGLSLNLPLIAIFLHELFK